MKQITLHTFGEKAPRHGDYIAWFPTNFYDNGEIRTGEVEYFWDNNDGGSISYERGDKAPNGYELKYMVSGMELGDKGVLWVKTKEFFK